MPTAFQVFEDLTPSVFIHFYETFLHIWKGTVIFYELRQMSVTYVKNETRLISFCFCVYHLDDDGYIWQYLF
jgi:hypothetical protein